MHKDVMVARIKFHKHRVRLWNLYKDLTKRHPHKYKIIYDAEDLSFHLFLKNKWGAWKPWAQSQSWHNTVGHG